jgi:hypothetical protein
MQRLRNLLEHQHGGVAGAELEIGEMTLGQTGGRCQTPPAVAPASTQGADAFSQGDEEAVRHLRLARGCAAS